MTQERATEERESSSSILVQESEKSPNFIALCIIAGPLPVLFSINYVLSLWNLDRFHYILFQLVFVLLLPTLLRVQNGSKKMISFSPEASKLILKRGSSESHSITNSSLSQFDSKLINNVNAEVEVEQSPTRSESPRAPVHAYSKTCDELFEEFETVIKGGVEDPAICWELMVDIAEPIPLTVYRDRHTTHRYRLECVFDNTPASVYDSMAGLFEAREGNSTAKKYLKTLEKLELLDANTEILYACTASVWPTSARDVCLLQSSRNFDDESIMTVLKSVNHPLKRKDSSNSAVRMDVHLAGRWLRPIHDNPKKCNMVSYFHGDPQGWIPKSLVTFMASNFIPKVFRQVNSKVLLLPFRERSLKLVNYFMESPPVSATLTEVTLNEDAYSDSPVESVFDEELTIQDQNPQLESTLFSPSSKDSFPQTPSSRSLAPPPSTWDRMRKKLTSRWWINKVTTSSGPILIVVAILAVMARRNRS